MKNNWNYAIILLFSATSIVPLDAQTKSIAESIVNPGAAPNAKPFRLEQVRLLPGTLKEAMDRNLKYLLSLGTDRLVYNFRVNAKLPTNAIPLGGWEKPDVELRGHFTGHFMSACGFMYASTGDERLKTIGKTIVSELANCQQALGSSGYLSAFPEEFIDRVESGKRVWAPWYTLHKVYAGLLDMYQFCDDKQALSVLKKAISWVKMRTDRLDDKQMQDMLKNEHGGMTEVLSNLYGVTGNEEYLALARRFEHRSFLDPLKENRDQLKGLHVNTQIPKVIGSAREYELTGDRAYHDAALFFWNQVVQARSYATGGTSNFEYWRDEPHKLADQLSQETHENCCTYNMLKLTEHLFSWNPEARFMDYYERALFNGILPTQHPGDRGGLMYYVPLRSGLFKMFGLPDSAYFCCNGTGVESFGKLANNIYYSDKDGIFVNLFIPSELDWKEKGIIIRQETQFPEQESTSIVIKSKTKTTIFALRVRIPYWATNGVSIRINGKPVEVSSSVSSYLILSRRWRDGDRVDVSFPMNLHLSRMPDDHTVAAILYGPVVLAGGLGTDGMTMEMQSGFGWPEVDRMNGQGAAVETPDLAYIDTDPNSWIVPVAGEKLTFRTVGVGKPKEVTLIPFYKMFGQRYAVYWNVYSPDEWKAVVASRDQLPDNVVDRIHIGNKLSDRAHNYQAYRFQSGERLGKKWIKSNLMVRYDLNIASDQSNALRCTYWGNDSTAAFDILIDGLLMTTQALNNEKPGEFFEKEYDLAPDLVKGKKRVAVAFRAKENKSTCELYGCAIVKSTK